MIEGYLILASRIRQELSDIDRILTRAQGAITRVKENPEDLEYYIDAASLNLHDFYTGIERIFRLIATTVDCYLPTSPEWHTDLLQQMAREMPQLRPAVISQSAFQGLDEFLRFRHVLRNIYTFSLKSDQVTQLVNSSDSVYKTLKSELLEFTDFLEVIGKS